MANFFPVLSGEEEHQRSLSRRTDETYWFAAFRQDRLVHLGSRELSETRISAAEGKGWRLVDETTFVS